MTPTSKAYDFPLSIRWLSGRRTVASVHGKDDLEIATPPEFNGGVDGVWSPEDLLVASIGSCFAVTLLAVAERRGIPLRGLEIDASGHVTRRSNGPFGFTEKQKANFRQINTGYPFEGAASSKVSLVGHCVCHICF